MNQYDSEAVVFDPRGAVLDVLEDGQVYVGEPYGASFGTTSGEIVFATGMTGYQETLTIFVNDRQIVVRCSRTSGTANSRGTTRNPPIIWVAGYGARSQPECGQLARHRQP